MERIINVSRTPESKDIRIWRKIGGGSLRYNGHILKPNQKFKATQEELPTAFLDVIVPADLSLRDRPDPNRPPAKGSAGPPEIKPVEVVYTVKARGTSGGWYDVVDSNGKALNEKALKKEIAEKLVHDLSK